MSKLLKSSRRIRVPRIKISSRLGAGTRGLRGAVPQADAVRPAVACKFFGKEIPADHKCPADCKLRAACYAAYVKAMEAAA